MSSFIQQIRCHQQVFLDRLAPHSFAPATAQKILAYGAPVGALIEHHEQLNRCMGRLQFLIEKAEQQGQVLEAGTVVLADTLTESSGRFDRIWYAPQGGIWLAMAWPDILLPEFTRFFPFAVGMACCCAVRQYGIDAHLKWVNDILVNGKKLAGILCTSIQSPGGDRYHLIGIGINANNQIFPGELQNSATSLRVQLSRKIDLAELSGCLLAELRWAIGLLHYDEEQALAAGENCEQGRQSLLLEDWQQLSDTVGQRVEYGFDIQQKPLYQAVAREIDPCGGLVMELEDGARITEYSGEIIYL